MSDAFSIDEKKLQFAATLVSLYDSYIQFQMITDSKDEPTLDRFIRYLLEEADKVMNTKKLT